MGELLRLATAGGVDDGKSTLIGRLLFDTKAILTDQLAAVERTSLERGASAPDLALLTDGLRAEREQGITIDVAYRYFATPARKFVIADTPGHAQHTRNMVTGASTAQVAVILVDAVHGMREQSRRHAFIAGLLGIRHLVVCVNKMDLVGYREQRFAEITEQFRAFAAKLEVHDVAFIPVCALDGENVVHRGPSMPWFDGMPLLRHLEHVHVASDRNLIDVRLPVQHVLRDPDAGARGYAGTMAGGVLRPGDEVLALPSGAHSKVAELYGPGGAALAEAFPPQAVTVRLADELDVGRGDLLCRPENRAHVARGLDAMVCWFDERAPLRPGANYGIRHTTQATTARIEAVDYRLDVQTLHREPDVSALSLNEIGRVRLRTRHPLLHDPYRRNRETGGFILVDERTGDTVGAGMISGHTETNVVWQQPAVHHGGGLTVWLTGLSAAGKSAVAVELERRLAAAGRQSFLLDGDNLRHGLNADLGFSRADRDENVRRTGEVAKLFAQAGFVAIAPLISPYRRARQLVRQAHEEAGLPFLEVHVDTPIELCEARDPKGLYGKARAGQLTGFTGVDDPYEPPPHPEVVLRPEHGDPAALAAEVLAAVEQEGSGRC